MSVSDLYDKQLLWVDGNMNVLVACEFSGIVRDAFRAKGHNAISCDILPSERPEKPHHIGDVLEYIRIMQLGEPFFDLMIAHPPCTHLAVSGARWFKEKIADGRQQQAIDFFMTLINAPILKICVENPVSIMSTYYRKPDQTIQPFQFGHEVQKATCLWLKNLPKLVPTKIVDRGMIYVDPKGQSHGGEFCMRAKKAYSPLMLLPRNQERWKIRSRTFQGIAEAMADQWG
jgi:hypothetical protein